MPAAGGGTARPRQRVAQPRHALAPSGSDVPEPLQAADETQTRIDGVIGALRGQPSPDSSQVRQLPVEQVEPLALVRSEQGRLGSLHQIDGPLGESLAGELGTVGFVQLVAGELARGLEHLDPDAGAGTCRLDADQVRFGQDLHEVEERRRRGGRQSPHRHRRLGRRAGCEHAERGECLLRRRRQEPEAPLQGGAHAPVLRGGVAATAAEQVQDLVEMPEHLGRGHDPGSSRRQFDRQRQTVEPDAELGDGGEVVGTLAVAEPGRRRALEEQAHARPVGRVVAAAVEGADHESHLAGDPQRDAAGCDDAHVGTGSHQGCDVAGGVRYLLHVVEHERE